MRKIWIKMASKLVFIGGLKSPPAIWDALQMLPLVGLTLCNPRNFKTMQTCHDYVSKKFSFFIKDPEPRIVIISISLTLPQPPS